MLSIGKLGAGQGAYYVESVAAGLEDYYAGEGEAPGEWVGSANADLGLRGEVVAEDFYAALELRDPSTGAPLRSRNTAISVPGFDLTFGAPKSVSVVWALAGGEAREAVREAHDAAVRQAVGYLEANACGSRMGAGGRERVVGRGFVAAAWRHRASRAGDVHLHTHVTIANITQCPDGEWRTLDGAQLYAHGKTAGYLYQAALRAELTRRLGVEWGAIRNGMADITGVPAKLLKVFSKRRTEIESGLAARHESSAKSAQVVALQTRKVKDYEVDGTTLLARWAGETRAEGFEPAQVVAEVLGRDAFRGIDEEELTGVFEVMAAAGGLTKQSSSFDARDVIQAVAAGARQGGDVDAIVAAARDFLRSDRVVPLIGEGGRETTAAADFVRRQDGQLVPSTADRVRYSTPDLLAVERDVLERAVAGVDVGAGVVETVEVLQDAIGARPTLRDEQGQMVWTLTRNGDRVTVVEGKAGAGKTYALAAAREAWEAGGYRVIGAAVARRAAHELQSQAGIESTSITGLLNEFAEGTTLLDERTVLVVDEASMLATRELQQLVERVDDAGAKLVLVGDPHQLPEIDAGGTFRGLLGRLPAIRLIENRRQSEAWERDALDLLRGGQVREAMEAYVAHGRVVLAEDPESLRARMVGDWWTRHGESQEAVMIASTRDDVRDLNGRAHELLRAAGRLSDGAVVVGGDEFHAGDEIVAQLNSRRYGVTNGTRATVTGVDPVGRRLRIQTTDDREILLDPGYLDQRTRAGRPVIAYGYAITNHKAQGMTTGEALVLGTDLMAQEDGFVALSRGRTANHFYVVEAEPERDEWAPRDVEQLGTLDRAISALERTRAQTMASDVAQEAAAKAKPTRELEFERDQLAAVIGPAPTERDYRTGERLGRQLADAQAQLAGAQEQLEVVHQQRPADPRDLESHWADLSREADATERARQRVEGLRSQLAQLPPGSEDPAAWLADRVDQLGRLAAVTNELRARETRVMSGVVKLQPAYLTRVLGPLPERLSGREEWRRAAVAIERYRTKHGVTDPVEALGERPNGAIDLKRAQEYREVSRTAANVSTRLAGRSAARARATERDRPLPPPRRDFGPEL